MTDETDGRPDRLMVKMMIDRWQIHRWWMIGSWGGCCLMAVVNSTLSVLSLRVFPTVITMEKVTWKYISVPSYNINMWAPWTGVPSMHIRFWLKSQKGKEEALLNARSLKCWSYNGSFGPSHRSVGGLTQEPTVEALFLHSQLSRDNTRTQSQVSWCLDHGWNEHHLRQGLMWKSLDSCSWWATTGAVYFDYFCS